MLKNILVAMSLLFLSSTVLAAAEDDPLLYKVMIDQLEIRQAESDTPMVWNADVWIGKDLNKLWISTSGEREEGELEEANIQLLYGRAISTFWDLQVGIRHDLKPEPDENRLALGFKGLTPYLFETSTMLYLNNEGLVELTLDMEYEYMFTQRLVLSPEVEMTLYNKDDVDGATGSGLSDMEFGLRLRYEIRREFAPYVGLNWSRKFGDTADFISAAGGDYQETQFVIGVRTWF